MFECIDVARTFGKGKQAFVALHDVGCSAAAGDRIAVVGPSGSGKSTFLQLVAGLDAPTSGTIRWPGLDQNRRTARGPWDPFQVGLVFQNESLIPGLTALENVATPLLFAGRDVAAAERIAERAMESVGVARLAPRLPSELSGGQSQRVAIARLVATEPALMLADEPTGRVDHDTAVVVVEALVAAADEVGATLLIATHDPAVAGRLDHEWRMRDGSFESFVEPDRAVRV